MEMNTLQQRQQNEMAHVCENVGFAYTQKDIVNISSRHVAEIEVGLNMIILLTFFNSYLLTV